MKRYLMTFAYDGTLFKGYQKQPKGRTVQTELETALSKINNKAVKVVASGRTDAMVHAYRQKAHFDLEIKITLSKLKQAVNSLIPNDIYVREIIEVDKDFHARFNVKGKQYCYKMNLGEYNPLERNYVYQYNRPLDIKAMEEALQYLVGEHNYKSFSKTAETKEDYVRIIKEISLIMNNNEPNRLELVFTGTGFFRYMIRNMVGTLIEIGQGKRKSNDIITILAAEDRRKAGHTANPEGLYLQDVFY